MARTPEAELADRAARLAAFRGWIEELARKHDLDFSGVARRAGLAPSTVTRPLNQEGYTGRVSSKTIGVIANAFSTKPPRLLRDLDVTAVRTDLTLVELGELASNNNAFYTKQKIDVENTDRLIRALPVVSRQDAAFGPSMFVRETEIFVPRPPELLRSFDAFAVYYTGSAMEPAIKRGSLLLVDPSMPVRRHDYVVIRLRTDELKTREFLNHNGRVLVIATYQGQYAEDAIPFEELVWVYRIVTVRLP